LAEASASTGQTLREYVWFNGRPMAVFDAVETGTPVGYQVHVPTSTTPRQLASRTVLAC